MWVLLPATLAAITFGYLLLHRYANSLLFFAGKQQASDVVESSLHPNTTDLNHDDEEDQIEWKVKMEAAERYTLRNFWNPSFQGGNNILVCMEYTPKQPTQFLYDIFVNNSRSVLDGLQKRHPFLAVGLSPPDYAINLAHYKVDIFNEGWHFVKRKTVPKIPLLEVRTEWENAARKEMNTGWDMNGPFMRLTICDDPSNHHLYLIFCWHHCVCDASSCSRLVQDFIGILDYFDHSKSDSASNQELKQELAKAETRPIPKSVIEQVPSGQVKSRMGILWFYTKFCANVFYNIGLRTCGLPLVSPLPPKRDSDFHMVILDRADTSALIRKCKEKDVTVTNLLHAVLVYNVVKLVFPHKRNSSRSRSIPVPVTIDLRKHKLVSSTDEDFRFLSSCIIPFLTIRYDLSNDMWDLAHQSRDQMRDLVQKDAPVGYYQSLILNSNFPQENTDRLPLLIANLGVVDILEGKQARAVLKHCSYSTQGVTNKISIASFSTDGRLIVDMSWNAAVARDTVDKYAEQVKQTLVHLAATPAASTVA